MHLKLSRKAYIFLFMCSLSEMYCKPGKKTLKFEVYDLDQASSKLDKHDFLGECQVNLGELVCDPNGISLPLKQRDGSIFQGHLKARAEELLKSREFFKLRFEANGVSKGLFGSGFFFQIERANEDGSFGVVTRSKVLTSGPYVWSLPISGEKLCNGDLSRTLRIGFWKYKGNGSHKMQGKDRKFTSRNRYHELLWEVFSKRTESRKYSFLNIF